MAPQTFFPAAHKQTIAYLGFAVLLAVMMIYWIRLVRRDRTLTRECQVLLLGLSPTIG